MSGCPYYVSNGMSVLLRKRGSTVKRQFVERQEIPAEFLPEPDKLQTMVDAGTLVTVCPDEPPPPTPGRRPRDPVSLDHLTPQMRGIVRRMGMWPLFGGGE